MAKKPDLLVIHLFEENGERTQTVHRLVEVEEAWFNAHARGGAVEAITAGQNKQDWHLAAGKVHIQQFLRGGFTCYYGDTEHPDFVHLGVGEIAVWQDDEGAGHFAVCDADDVDGAGSGCVTFHSYLDQRIA